MVKKRDGADLIRTGVFLFLVAWIIFISSVIIIPVSEVLFWVIVFFVVYIMFEQYFRRNIKGKGIKKKVKARKKGKKKHSKKTN